ncbi:MAG: hypothetical protein LBP61_01635 [Desulfovibrio sp.]|jgi:hypothetical protein|nr:hypothetical protein [Desulfovibrio sp.]
MYLSVFDLRRVLDRRQADLLCRVWGGVSTYLPVEPDPRHDFAGVLGRQGMAILCAAFGGQNVTLPNANHMSKKSEIVARLERGESPRLIALELKVTERWVRHLAAAHQRPAAVQGSLLEILRKGNGGKGENGLNIYSLSMPEKAAIPALWESE